MAEGNSWKNVNVNLGVLSACILGVLTVVSSSIGVQYWVDDRINRALDPVEARLDSAVSECRRACYRWQGEDNDDTMAYQMAACEVEP